MQRISRAVIVTIAFVLVFMLVWQKLRIVLFIPLSLGQAAFLFGGAVLAIFLVLDHLINRNRD